MRSVAILLVLLGLTLAATTGAHAKAHTAHACAPGYAPCLPVVSDLDCGQIPDSKKPVRVTGSDPYGLDRDRDGLGCEVAGRGGGRQSPWGVILRKPPRKEATTASVGDTLTVVGWSPPSFNGERYAVCAGTSSGRETCRGRDRYDLLLLRGRVQTFGTWEVHPGEARKGTFKMTLVVKGRTRAFDTVPLR